MRSRTNIEQISHDLNRAVELDTASRTSFVIRAPSDYQGNIGLVFGDFPDMTVDMITAYFEDLLSTQGMSFDEESLFYSIFGKTFGTRDDIDPSTIRAWLSDISTNVEKRSFMGEALFGYLQEVQSIDPLDRSPGQKILTDAVAAKFQQERDATARALLERKAEFDRNNLAAMSYYELKNDIETLKGRTAAVAQGFLDDKRTSNGYTENEQLILEQLIATAGDVRDAALTIELLDAWAAERRAAGREREFVDDQIAGLRAELQEVQDKRTALRNIMQDESQTGYQIADSGIEALFGNFTPYSDFLAEVRLNALDAKLANYDIIGSIVGGAAGTNEGSSLVGTAAGLGAATAAGFTSATSYTRFVAPYAYRMVNQAGVTSLRLVGGGSRLAGPIGATLTAAISITDRAFQTFQEDEQRIIFEGLTEDIGKPVNFNDIDITSALDISDPDFDPTPEEMKAVIEREYLADALNSMLLGL